LLPGKRNKIAQESKMGNIIFREIGIAASMGLAAVGACIGAWIVGSATIGAWKRCFAQNKPASFLMVAFAGQPLSNLIYGFISMNALAAASPAVSNTQILFTGLFAGIGIGGAAIAQCYCGACAAEALAETDQGFGNYIMVIGICETIALFVMVFSMMFVGNLGS
jgi:V/A-type H+-transporting ATPase subunit K